MKTQLFAKLFKFNDEQKMTGGAAQSLQQRPEALGMEVVFEDEKCSATVKEFLSSVIGDWVSSDGDGVWGESKKEQFLRKSFRIDFIRYEFGNTLAEVGNSDDLNPFDVYAAASFNDIFVSKELNGDWYDGYRFVKVGREDGLYYTYMIKVLDQFGRPQLKVSTPIASKEGVDIPLRYFVEEAMEGFDSYEPCECF